MSKKIIAIILVVVGLLAIAAGVFLIFNKDSDTKNEGATEQQGESTMNKDGKAIVVYFSAQNHTRNVATKIAANVGADIFEIEPVQAYTEDDLSWTDSESRVSREHNDESLQTIELKNTTIPNWDEYKTVYIGYPIWWGGSAWPVDSFVKKVDFGDKIVIPFCTSHSSGLGTSDTDLKAKATGGNWQPGHRFSQELPTQKSRLGPIVCYNIHIGQLSRIMPIVVLDHRLSGDSFYASSSIEVLT